MFLILKWSLGVSEELSEFVWNRHVLRIQLNICAVNRLKLYVTLFSVKEEFCDHAIRLTRTIWSNLQQAFLRPRRRFPVGNFLTRISSGFGVVFGFVGYFGIGSGWFRRINRLNCNTSISFGCVCWFRNIWRSSRLCIIRLSISGVSSCCFWIGSGICTISFSNSSSCIGTLCGILVCTIKLRANGFWVCLLGGSGFLLIFRRLNRRGFRRPTIQFILFRLFCRFCFWFFHWFFGVGEGFGRKGDLFDLNLTHFLRFHKIG